MFTGIVEETGVVEGIKPSGRSIELAVRARVCARDVKAGDSVSVNGCCLTVTGIGKPRGGSKSGGRVLKFDLLKETWNRTNLKYATVGAAVNLERALAVGDRLGGHFVTGHIDGTGTIMRWERKGADHVLEVSAPPEVMQYVIFKGSVAVDGISLTVAAVGKKGFRIWVIPHTFEVTALKKRQVGDAVNLEADLLGKYVRQFVTSKTGR